jgi:hypothetical protein
MSTQGERFLFPGESYFPNTLATKYWSIDDCGRSGCKSRTAVRSALVPLSHSLLVSATQSPLWRHKFLFDRITTGGGIQEAYNGSNKSYLGIQISSRLAFTHVFQSWDHYLVAQLNHGSLDSTMRVYRDEQKHGGGGRYELASCLAGALRWADTSSPFLYRPPKISLKTMHYSVYRN